MVLDLEWEESQRLRSRSEHGITDHKFTALLHIIKTSLIQCLDISDPQRSLYVGRAMWRKIHKQHTVGTVYASFS